MKLEAIHDMWENDTHIDKTRLTEETIKIPKLMAKYKRIYSVMRQQREKTELELASLRQDKVQFIRYGETKETQEKGWVWPGHKITEKGSIDLYLDADPDMQALMMKLNNIKAKEDLLKTIMEELRQRSFHIRNIIEWEKFINGG